MDIDMPSQPSSEPRGMLPSSSMSGPNTPHVGGLQSSGMLPTSSAGPPNGRTPHSIRSRGSTVLPSQASSEPLFFPMSDAGSPAPRRNIRGDIHSSMPPSTPGAVTTGTRNVEMRPAPRATPHSRLASSALGGMSDTGSDRLLVPTGAGSRAATHNGSDADPDATGPRKVIWGTSVGLDEAMTAFKLFLSDYKPKYRMQWDREQALLNGEMEDEDKIAQQHAALDGEKLLYEHYMRTMRLTSQTNLNLDMLNLAAFPPTRKLERWLRTYPQEVVPMCDQVLKDAMIDLGWADQASGAYGPITDDEIYEMNSRIYKIRPFASTEHGRGDRDQAMSTDRHIGVNMRDLGPGDIDKLVTIKGLVIRATPIIPDMKSAFFRCLTCMHTITADIDRGRIEEPAACPRETCGLKGGMSLIHNRCEFSDRQVIRLQETPDAVPDGQTPHTVSLCVYDELVDIAKPGDRVTITGIFRSVAVRVNPRQRTIKSLFKTYIDVLHVKKTDAKRLGLDTSTREGEGRFGSHVGVGGEDDFEREQELGLQDELADAPDNVRQSRARHQEELVALSRRPDIYEFLSRSLAPSIWEMDDIKKGILLQLFGGTNKSISRGGGSGGPRYRGDINVLLVGDPGTSKSQILQYVHKIAPRGIYTSGKGSSAVGLTAYVTRDPDSKQLVLESGALVLSDGGVCCIDEFDKMSDATRSVLHEVMEQQTVSIAKAGIITTLNARSSILAAANPVGSKYNLHWPITKNIDLPPTLISRFDLLYLVLDRVDETHDRRLAKHLVSLYLEDRPETGGSDIMPVEQLTTYVSFARNHIHPRLTQEASDLLVKNYVAMRKAGIDPRSSDRRITATTRQLESGIRLSEAHARMRFSDTVDAEDVEEAFRLIREALKESATDPITGLLDLDMLNTGHGMAATKLRNDLKAAILVLLESGDIDRGMRWGDLAKAINDQSSVAVEPTELTDIVKSLETEGSVRVTGDRDRRTVRRIFTG